MIIKTERLRIQSFIEGMISDEYLSWLNDKEHMKYSEQRHSTHTKETAAAWLAERTRPGEGRVLMILLDGSGVGHDFPHIGNIAVETDFWNMTADMGILMSPDYTKSGYGTEAWVAVRDHLIEKGYRKITCGCMRSNRGMMRLARNTMYLSWVRPNLFLFDGKEEDGMYFAYEEPR